MEERVTVFWRADSVFSQWHAGTPFERHGRRFATAENWMMWQKAQPFGAAEAKQLGRLVPGFVEAVWQVAARPLVAAWNYAKLTQIRAALHATAGITLVGASHRLSGIGLGAEDPRALSRATWLGRNWLGEVLTDIRGTLMAARLDA